MKTALSNLGNATASQVQSGKTFTSSSGVSVTGTLPYRGVAQEVTTYGSGDWDTDNPYFAINKIPQGIYASEGYEWGPEVRIRTKYLGTATADKVLSGYTYTSKDAVVGSGTMTNQGSWSATVNPGSSVTIPAGYHNGSGVVSANGGAGRSRACSWTYTTAKSFTERLDSGYSGKYVTQIFFFCSNDCRWMVFSNLYAIDTSGNEFAVFDDTNTNTWYLSYVAPINKYIDHFEWRVTNTQNNQGYDFVYCSALLVEYK